MTVVDDVDQLTEQYQLGLEEFMKGNPEPVKDLFSHRGAWMGSGRCDHRACLILYARWRGPAL